jgi:asparagine synthase (glutamine-hydrolysing)
MCRVAAIVSTNIEDIKDRIILMKDAMKNGGPDDDGFYINETLGVALGHRRLSIIDVSENGHQPMSYLQ